MNVITNNYYFRLAGEGIDYVQTEIDRKVDKVKQEFAPYSESLNQWLEQKGEANWTESLTSSLIKLPTRSALNVMTSLYVLVSDVFYTIVHPLKGTAHLIKSAVALMNELTKPEVWSKIGTGSVGMIVGQGLVLSGSFSLIGLFLAGALSIGGISVETFIAMLRSEKGKEMEAIKEKLGSYLQQLPEMALTGFFSGLLIGGVKRTCQSQINLKNRELKKMSIGSGQASVKTEIVAKHNFQTIENVIITDWENATSIFSFGKAGAFNFEQIAGWAEQKAKVTHFFICNLEIKFPVSNSEYCSGIHLYPGDAVFFSGAPNWVPAPGPGMATGYIKL